MLDFLSVLNVESRRIFRLKILIVLLVILGVCLYSVHRGIKENESVPMEITEFQKIENLIFNDMANYEDISNVGFKVLFVPTTTGIFFTNSETMSEIFARINTIATLHIYKNLQSKALFKKDTLFQFRFSSIVSLLGSILVLLYGYYTPKNREYLKFLSSTSTVKSAHYFMVISRVLLIISGFLLIFAAMHLLAIIEGVDLSQVDFTGLAAYIFAALLLLLFFFAVGRAIGSLGSKLFEGLAMLLVIWFSFIYFIPGILATYIEDKADNIPSFHELYEKKMKIVDDFEKRALEEIGKFTEEKRAIAGEYTERYIENEYRQIEALEEQFKNEIADVAESCNNLRILFPTTFYNMVSSEVSGRSYQNFLDFYSYLQKLRRQFLRHWKDRVYKHDVKVLVNFVKGDENLFKARSRLSQNYWKGVIINSVWVILAILVGNFLFKRNIFPKLKNTEDTKVFKADFQDTDTVNIVSMEPYPPEITGQIPNVFFGQIKHFEGNISIEGESIVTKKKKPALFLTHPDNFPEDLKTKHLMNLYKSSLKLTQEEYKTLRETAGLHLMNKTFAKMKYFDKADVLLAIMKLKKWKIYILHDFGFGLNHKERFILTNKLDSMGIDDVLIINIITKGDNWLHKGRYIYISMEDGKVNLS